jgi:hypothetical protein
MSESKGDQPVNGHMLDGALKRKHGASPPIQATILVFLGLFVLLLWLDFVMAQQIESRGREIQVKTEELHTIERRQKALLKEISAAGSEQRMAEQAAALGYRPQTPIYLPVAHALSQSTGNPMGSGETSTTAARGEREMALSGYSLLDMLARELKAMETAP